MESTFGNKIKPYPISKKLFPIVSICLDTNQFQNVGCSKTKSFGRFAHENEGHQLEVAMSEDKACGFAIQHPSAAELRLLREGFVLVFGQVPCTEFQGRCSYGRNAAVAAASTFCFHKQHPLGSITQILWQHIRCCCCCCQMCNEVWSPSASTSGECV